MNTSNKVKLVFLNKYSCRDNDLRLYSGDPRFYTQPSFYHGYTKPKDKC